MSRARLFLLPTGSTTCLSSWGVNKGVKFGIWQSAPPSSSWLSFATNTSFGRRFTSHLSSKGRKNKSGLPCFGTETNPTGACMCTSYRIQIGRVCPSQRRAIGHSSSSEQSGMKGGAAAEVEVGYYQRYLNECSSKSNGDNNVNDIRRTSDISHGGTGRKKESHKRRRKESVDGAFSERRSASVSREASIHRNNFGGKMRKQKPKRPRRRPNFDAIQKVKNPNGNTETTFTEDKTVEPLKEFHLFASCLPGLEPLLYTELVSLGFRPNLLLDAAVADESGEEMSIPQHTSERKGAFGQGGITFTATSISDVLKCHLHLGTASHILLRCGEPFRARMMDELQRKVGQMTFWRQYFGCWRKETRKTSRQAPNIDIRVTSTKSRLYHTKGVAERVQWGIHRALGLDTLEQSCEGDAEMVDLDDLSCMVEEDAEEDENVTKILVRIDRDVVQISIDTSPTPLHRRGYKLQTGKAPLREDLAFALLHSAGWWAQTNKNTILQNGSERSFHDKTTGPETQTFALLDPFCGSGTIVIEGAAMLLGLPPGRLRPAPLRGSCMYDEAMWTKLVQDAVSSAEKNRESMEKARNVSYTSSVGSIGEGEKVRLISGCDRDEGVIDAAISNAERAGVADIVEFRPCAISSHPWFEKRSPLYVSADCVIVATNPPFGKRIAPSKGKKKKGKGHNPLLPLYQVLGHRIERLAEASSCGQIVKAAFIAHDTDLVRRTGLKGLRVQFSTHHGGMPVSAVVKE